MSFDVPILFLVYNRQDTTQKVFQRIKEIKPEKLFLAADGPRIGKEGDKEKCEDVRKIILQGIDWPCDVKTLFRDKNLGCGLAVSGAITWFFENVEEGIILEDDTLPDLSFFTFCKSLLEKYRHEDRIKMISGNNFQKGKWRGDGSYYFSAYNHIWGWASWRRTWVNYDYSLTQQDGMSLDQSLDYYFSDTKVKKHWVSVFQKVKAGEIDTWDYQFLFSIWKNKGLCILPNQNLVSNIGFGQDSTHTKQDIYSMANLAVSTIAKIIHPSKIKRWEKADEFFFQKYLTNNQTVLRIIKRLITR